MICAVFYEKPLVPSRGWDEGSVQSYLSQWMKGGVWPSPLKGQYTPPTVTAATSRPKPMCLLWPRLAGYLPSAPYTHLHPPPYRAQGWPVCTWQGLFDLQLQLGLASGEPHKRGVARSQWSWGICSSSQRVTKDWLIPQPKVTTAVRWPCPSNSVSPSSITAPSPHLSGLHMVTEPWRAACPLPITDKVVLP